MSKRPKWMPTEGTVWNIQDGDYVDAEIESEFYRTGLRAQIAVLEELREQLTTEMTGAADAIIFAKIAALRKEIGE